MIKGIFMLSGWIICLCVYGPKRFKQLNISPAFCLLITGVFAAVVVCAAIASAESIVAMMAVILCFLLSCIVWAIIVRKKYPIKSEGDNIENQIDDGKKEPKNVETEPNASTDKNSCSNIKPENSMPLKQHKKKTKKVKIKYCGHCGSLIDNKTKICIGCGKKHFNGTKFAKIFALLFLLVVLLISVTLNIIQFLEIQYWIDNDYDWSFYCNQLENEISNLENQLDVFNAKAVDDFKEHVEEPFESLCYSGVGSKVFHDVNLPKGTYRVTLSKTSGNSSYARIYYVHKNGTQKVLFVSDTIGSEIKIIEGPCEGSLLINADDNYFGSSGWKIVIEKIS